MGEGAETALGVSEFGERLQRFGDVASFVGLIAKKVVFLSVM